MLDDHPIRAFGALGSLFVVVGMLVLILALSSDMLNRLRINKGKLFYELKRIRYGN